MSLTYVAAGRGIVLAPGFADDHNGVFAWIPFDCPEYIKCVLTLIKLIKEIAQNTYRACADSI